jgi:hypothetical protein
MGQTGRNTPCPAAASQQHGWEDAAMTMDSSDSFHRGEMPDVLADLMESSTGDRHLSSISSRHAYAQQVWSDVQDALSKMHATQMHELQVIINSRQKLVDDKLDRMSDRLWQLSTGNINIDCSNLNLDLSPLTNECKQMSEHVTQAIGNLQDAQADLRSGVEAKLANVEEQVGDLLSRVHEMRSDTQEGKENALVMRGQFQQFIEQPVVDLDPVLTKVTKCCHFVEEDFRLVAAELGVIQRALQLDFVRMPGQAGKRRNAPNASHPRGMTVRTMTAQNLDRDDEDQSFGAPDLVRAVTSHPVSPRTPVAGFGLTAKKYRGEAEAEAEGEDQARDLSAQSEPLATTYKKQTRHRDIFVQTDKKPLVEMGTQTKPEELQKSTPQHEAVVKQRKSVRTRPFKGYDERNKERLKREDELKKQARKNLTKEQYDVMNFYHTTGIFQKIARSHYFENVTGLVVLLNTFWIAIDVDHNNSALITDAEPIFQVVENCFCAYFTAEMIIRFGAFAKKCNACKDGWFVYDFALVTNMVVETWIVPVIVVGIGIQDVQNTLDLTALRAFRIVKLLRLTRMTKFLRMVPELVVIIKALIFCARSMAIFLLLWLGIIYVFAVVFRQISSDTSIGNEFFRTVPRAMKTLLLDGLLADYAPIMHSVFDGSVLLGFVLLIFVLLASVTIMYMLMGVMFESLATCLKNEKEAMTVTYMASTLRQTMISLGYDVEGSLSQERFGKLLAEPDFVHVLNSVHVDVVALVEMLSIIYEDIDLNSEDMTFEKVVDLVLNLRGKNFATVSNTNETVRVLKAIMQSNMATLCDQLHEEFSQLQEEIDEIRNSLDVPPPMFMEPMLDE